MNKRNEIQLDFFRRTNYHLSMPKMSPVVHFEMPAEDKPRAKKFYEEAFGWQMQQMGGNYGDYLLATTTPTDPKTTRPTEPGAINGSNFFHLRI